MADSLPLEQRRFRIAALSFSIINTLFLARMIWLVVQAPDSRRTLYLLLGFAVLCLALTVLGMTRVFRRSLSLIYSLPGSIVVVFGGIVLARKLLNRLIRAESGQIYSEIATWFVSLCLWVAAVYLITFLKELFRKTFPGQADRPTPDAREWTLRIGFAVVIALMAGFWAYTQLVDPLPVYATYDPEYSYMLNSATPLIDLELYQRLDHPGTILQLVGTGLTILLSPFSLLDGSYPYQYLLFHPRAFLFGARLAVLLLNIAVQYLFFRTFQYPRNWPSVLAGLSAMLAYFALHKDALGFLAFWSPNAFNFAIGTGLLVMLVRALTREKIEYRTLWILSIAFGLGATFHIYMITLILALLAGSFLARIFDGVGLFKAIGETIKLFVGFVSGYVIATLVILPEYGSYFTWVKSIVVHQGTYGIGETGFLSLTELARNFRDLVLGNLMLFLFIAGGILTALIILASTRKRRSQVRKTWALLGGVLLQLIALSAVISKHPADRYLLSIAAIVPVLIILIYQLLDEYQGIAAPYFAVTFTALLVLMGWNTLNSLENHQQSQIYLSSYQQMVEDFKVSYAKEVELRQQDLILYWSYGTFSNCYSLWFANDFSKNLYTNEISDICPKDQMFDIYDGTITNRNAKGLKALFRENPRNILVANWRTMDKYQGREHTRVINSTLNNLMFIVFQDSE